MKKEYSGDPYAAWAGAEKRLQNATETISELRKHIAELEVEKTVILTKVYGFTNRMKIDLAFNDTKAAFETLNKLTDYLVSVEVVPQAAIAGKGAG